MRVLFTINEAYPLYKIGGLGDVGGSLPVALSSLGVDIRLVLPHHPEIKLDNAWHPVSSFPLIYDRRSLRITVHSGFLPGTKVPTYLFHEPQYLSQHTDASDNHADKYAVFSLAIATWIALHSDRWQPHIVHTHDWHTALIPVFLRHLYDTNHKTILTIHNLAFQGNTTTPITKKTGLNPNDCRIIGWDGLNHDLNILLEGLVHSDHITTVSPGYAKEILTQSYGEQLEPILQPLQGKITGILNGLDYHLFNPQDDVHLPHHYTVTDAREGKRMNRQVLFGQLNLPRSVDKVLIGYIGRVDPHQKGIELIIRALSQHLLPLENSVFVFLGTGDPLMENLLHQTNSNPNVRIITRFDEPLAHTIYAAADLLLIPSLFEPCGLVQMIAMRYGALPVARATGGLKDTITHQHNGFLFSEYSTQAMIQSLHNAREVISNQKRHRQMITQAMSENFSWFSSAKCYLHLYQSVILS